MPTIKDKMIARRETIAAEIEREAGELNRLKSQAEELNNRLRVLNLKAMKKRSRLAVIEEMIQEETDAQG